MERCPTCHEDASRVSHRCRDCAKRCHAICGESVTEGYASFLRCTPCALALAAARLDTDTQDESATPTKRKRGAQNVSSIAQRRKVVKWMAAQDAAGLIHFQTAAVKQFPDIFVGDNFHAHVQKASQWWRARAAILALDGVDATGQLQAVRGSAKALTGRGRKRSAWVQWIYPKLYAEAARLQQVGVRTTIPVLRSAAQRILETSTDAFNRNFVDPSDGREIFSKITSRWIQAFCKAHPDINNHSRARKAQPTFDPEQLASGNEGNSADDADEDDEPPAPVRQRVVSEYLRSSDVTPGTLQALMGLGEKLLAVERGRVELLQKQFEFEMESRREELALRREIEAQRQREFELTYQAQQAKYELDRMALEAKLQKAGVSLQRRE